MCPVTEEEKVAAIKERLRKAAQADKRIDTAKDRTRKELREAILEAAALGLGPAEVARDIGHHLSEGHVARMIKGTA